MTFSRITRKPRTTSYHGQIVRGVKNWEHSNAAVLQSHLLAIALCIVHLAVNVQPLKQ